MASEPRPLERIRNEIDEVDASLVDLLSRRAALAQEVGRVKGADGKPFFTPERERQIYEKLEQVNPGPLQSRQLVSIFREIISAARAAEKPLSVSYWGPEGTFSHLAAIQTFGQSTQMCAAESIHDVFMKVQHGEADYGIVPVENSVAGVVPETLDMFPHTQVRICAETLVDVHHHLVSHASSLAEIERVYVGPQPLTQCRRWLREHLPHAERIEAAPTARAARMAQEDKRGAAIANRMTAEMLEFPVLAENIHDNPENRTRFLVVGFNEPAKTGRDKTSLMFNLKNRPGELYRALGAFDQTGVNLMMIESRPGQRQGFEYIFYVDVAGHRTDEKLRSAIEILKGYALETIVLGSYPSIDPMAG